jgi:two-component system, NarL family, nitrate/nitrite response regulator NarL
VSLIRIGIADPQTICREGVRSLLQGQGEFEVVGEASDGMEACVLAKEQRPHVLLMELDLPRRSGLETLKALKDSALSTRCLLFGSAIRREEFDQALQLGAYGWISKSVEAQLLFRSIRAVSSGEYWIGKEGVSQLVDTLRAKAAFGNGSAAASRFGLTERELEIIAKVSSGYTNREIATELSLCERSIKQHLTHVFDKVGASSRLELAVFALHHHLIE